MTNTARRHFLTIVRLAARRVASVTTVVRIQANWYRKPRAAQKRLVMTTVAAIARSRGAGHVLGMVKLHIEAFIEPRRKTLKRRLGALNIRMTNQAHRNSRSEELGPVTVGAGLVTGKFWSSRIICAAFVTGGAGKGSVTLAAVDEC